MRILLVLSILLLNHLGNAQHLDVQGNPSSMDTVVKIRVNYTGSNDVVGLSVISNPLPSSGFIIYGTGGYFYGGSNGVYGNSSRGSGVTGVSTSGSGVTAESTDGLGVWGRSVNDNGVYGYSTYDNGVYGYSIYKPGVYGLSYSDHGVHGHSESHFGVYGSSVSEVGVSGFSESFSGVRGWSNNSVGVVGYSGNSASYDFRAEGPGQDYGSTSSRRWKRNIVTIPDPLAKISRLRGVYFDWDEAHGGHHDIGFIAEEVGEVLPEIVVYEANGIDADGMDYSKMTPLLVEAVNALRKEYQEKFDRMELQIRDQQKEINQLQSDLTYPNNKKMQKKDTSGPSK